MSAGGGLRLRAKVDRNHAEIVSAFRQAGCSVVSLAQLGKGVPDLLVGRGEALRLVEVKAEGGSLTPDQERFIEAWLGPDVVIVRTAEEARLLFANLE